MKPNTLSKETIEYLQERVLDEYTAEHHYRAGSHIMKNLGYMKAAKFFLDESNSEITHAQKVLDYAAQWNVFLQIPALEVARVSPQLDVFIGESYELEYALLEKYMEDAKECFAMGDLTTFALMQEMIAIQNEAVAEYSDMLNMMELFDKSNPNWLFLFEKKLFG
jgi:ferritin